MYDLIAANMDRLIHSYALACGACVPVYIFVHRIELTGREIPLIRIVFLYGIKWFQLRKKISDSTNFTIDMSDAFVVASITQTLSVDPTRLR